MADCEQSFAGGLTMKQHEGVINVMEGNEANAPLRELAEFALDTFDNTVETYEQYKGSNVG